MKKPIFLMAFAASLSLAHAGLAQAPAGSTGICKDGTYTQSASKSGACRGHQGIKEWYAAAAAPAATATKAAPAAAAAPSAMPAKTATPAPAPAPQPKAAAPVAATTASAAPKAPSTRTSTASMTQAPGGGPGMVWVNTDSKVYHCPGTQFYGKTKEGKYMSEADAKAMGGHADHNHPCAK